MGLMKNKLANHLVHVKGVHSPVDAYILGYDQACKIIYLESQKHALDARKLLQTLGDFEHLPIEQLTDDQQAVITQAREHAKAAYLLQETSKVIEDMEYDENAKPN